MFYVFMSLEVVKELSKCDWYYILGRFIAENPRKLDIKLTTYRAFGLSVRICLAFMEEIFARQFGSLRIKNYRDSFCHSRRKFFCNTLIVLYPLH